MILQLALVPAKLHLEVGKSSIERVVGVLPLAFRFKNGTGIQMQRAVGTHERTVVGKHDIGFGSAVEMLADYIFQTVSHADGKRLANLYLFS